VDVHYLIWYFIDPPGGPFTTHVLHYVAYEGEAKVDEDYALTLAVDHAGDTIPHTRIGVLKVSMMTQGEWDALNSSYWGSSETESEALLKGKLRIAQKNIDHLNKRVTTLNKLLRHWKALAENRREQLLYWRGREMRLRDALNNVIEGGE
jgi:hypothetical protein